MGLTWVNLENEGGYSQLNTGSALASSTSLTDISAGANTAGQAFTVGADYFQVGFQYLILANGIVSNTATPNLTLGLYWGGVAGTALATTGAVATASSLSNTSWVLQALLRVDAVGTSGSARTIGTVTGPYASTVLIPASSATGNNVTINTGAASNVFTVGALWSANSSSNTITCMQFAVMRLNAGNI